MAAVLESGAAILFGQTVDRDRFAIDGDTTIFRDGRKLS